MVKGRIVVIAEYFPPRLGSDRRIYEFMKRLAKKYDVHFLVLPPSYTLFIRKIDTFSKKKGEVNCEGMSSHELNLPKLISRFWASSFLVAFAVTEFYLLLMMLRKMAAIKPNLIIINDTSIYTGLLGFVCGKLLKKKLLVDYNDLMAVYTLDLIGKKKSGILRTVLGHSLVLAEDTLVRYGWKVTTITHFIKDYASNRQVRKDLVVVPNGVDTSLFDPEVISGRGIRLKYGLSNNERLCVYAGRIEEVAGAEIILETARLLEYDNGIRFMLVGEGNSRMVGEFLKCENIILTGRVSKETVPEYLAAADCILVPFPESVASHGISPLKLFEALAMKKPIVASAISGIKETLCQDKGVLLVTNDPKSWADAILKTLEEGGEFGQGEVNSREFIRENYDFNRLADIFEAVVAEAF